MFHRHSRSMIRGLPRASCRQPASRMTRVNDRIDPVL